jgi:hypothetical protein
MTQDEIIEMAEKAGFDCYGKHITWDDVICTDELKAFAKLVAAKAIAELESQEPVAWMFQNDETGRMTFVESQQLERGWEKENQRYKKIGPLYTHPPQRTWVGLTDDEIQDAGRFSYCRGGTSEKLYHIMWSSQPSASVGWCREELISFAQAVEAKYQEKNQ